MEGTEPVRVLNPSTRAFIGFGAAFVMAVCLWFIAAYAISFHPYRIHTYTVIPAVGCSNRPVEVWLDFTIRHPRWGRTGAYELKSEWVDTRTNHIIALPTYYDTPERLPSGRRRGVSPILRSAPDIPGRWRLRSTMTFEGRVLRLKREAITPSQSENVFETWPFNDPRCTP